MGRKITYEEVKYFVEVESQSGCKLLSQEYIKNSTKMKFQCKCGNEFETTYNKFKDRNKRQCNDCGKKIMIEKQSNQISFTCDYCGKQSTQQPNQYNKSQLHFCNRKCQLSYQKQDTEEVECEYCGKNIKVTKSSLDRSSHHFCSKDCANKGRSIYQGGKNSPNWRGGKIKCKCDSCGIDIEVSQSIYYSQKHHYCSKECSYNGNPLYYSGENSKCYRRIKYKCDICGGDMKITKSKFDSCLHHYCSKECYLKGLSVHRSGENSPNWKPSKTNEERLKERKFNKYAHFRNDVFERDDYICQCCGRIGGKLNAHHLDGWNWCVEKRLDVNNGITLCDICHTDFHSTYGKGDNTYNQFVEWIIHKHNQGVDSRFYHRLLSFLLIINKLIMSQANERHKSS